MKRLILFPVALLVCILLLSACSGNATSTTAPAPVKTTQAAATSAATSAAPAPASATAATTTQPAAPAANVPIKGGILRCIRGGFPTVLAYPPDMGPMDSIFDLPFAERLNVWNEKGVLSPELAESWDVDPANKSITWHIRKGVQFHDGTPLNADAVRWNYQLLVDNRKLTDGNFLKSMEIVDEYTLKMNLTEINTQTVQNYGIIMIFSPTSIEKNGKEWARTHGIGTGPFKLADFQRDNIIKYVRNDNYWRKDGPYLDGIEIKLIPDVVTAAAMIQSKQADVWQDMGDVPTLVDLEKKGMKIVRGPGMFMQLLLGSSDATSPLSKLEVRQALSSAIDRKALCQALGKGQWEPMSQLVPSASPAYNKGYDPDPYDPARSKALLAKAGYPSGIKTKMLVGSAGGGKNDTAEAIKTYFDAAGAQTDIDIADLGRYFGAVFGTGFTDVVLSASGINPDATDLYVHFGPNPMTFRTGNIKKSQAFLDLCNQALRTFDRDKEIALMQQAIKQAGDDCMIIPLYRSAQACVMQPYVHSDYTKIHSIIWFSYQDWMEKH